MTVSEAPLSPDVDSALADFQGQLNLIFAKARLLWKDSAARIDPELQVTGYKLLTFLDGAGASSAHELAERFEMDKSVISRQVRMLECHGFLESRPDERDGRLRVLTVTSKARDALARVRGEYALRLRAAIGELTADEIRTASRVFRLLAEA